MSRQTADRNEEKALRLSPQARKARANRVEMVAALVRAGLYRVDSAKLAAALCRRGAQLGFQPRPAASFDTVAFA